MSHALPPMYVIAKDVKDGQTSVAYGVLATSATEAWKQLRAQHGEDFANAMRRQGYKAQKARIVLGAD